MALTLSTALATVGESSSSSVVVGHEADVDALFTLEQQAAELESQLEAVKAKLRDAVRPDIKTFAEGRNGPTYVVKGTRKDARVVFARRYGEVELGKIEPYRDAFGIAAEAMFDATLKVKIKSERIEDLFTACQSAGIDCARYFETKQIAKPSKAFADEAAKAWARADNKDVFVERFWSVVYEARVGEDKAGK